MPVCSKVYKDLQALRVFPVSKYNQLQEALITANLDKTYALVILAIRHIKHSS